MVLAFTIPLRYPGLTKVLVHSGPEASPDERDKCDFTPVVAYVCDYVKKHLPRLDHRKPAIQETCMYTMTPDSKPVMDWVEPNIVVGTGYSGSGFKHSPASGKSGGTQPGQQSKPRPTNVPVFMP